MPASRTARSRSRVVRGTVTTVVLALAFGLQFGGGAFAQLAGALGYGGYGGGCGYTCPPPPCGGYGGYGGPSPDCGDQRPDASIWLATHTPYAGATVQIGAYGSRPHAATLEWDLDDDGAYDDATGMQTSKLFADAGRHVVRLRVTDQHGRIALASQTVSVHSENFKPTGDMSVNPRQPRVGSPVTFSGYGSDQDGRIVKYEFDYDGNGTYDAEGMSGGYYPSPGAAPFQHTYTAAGVYEVAMRVTDDGGASTVSRRSVTVHETNLTPSMTGLSTNPQRPRVGTTFRVEPYATDADGQVVKLEADYDGDGTYDATVDGQFGAFQHAYATAGEHELVVRATDDGGATTVSRRIVAVGAENIAPTVSLWVSPDRPRVGATVTVNAYASDTDGSIARIEYDLDGDGAYETSRPQHGMPPTTVFQTPGTRTIRARAVDNDGAMRSAVDTIDVAEGNLAPRADMYWDPSSQRPALGTTTSFYAYGSQDPDGSIAEYAWDLDGDGEYDDVVGPYATQASKTFSTVGEYVVGLRVTDADGASGTVRHRFVVVASDENAPPVAKAQMAPQAPRSGHTVSFSAYGSTDDDGHITSYEWDLDGDGVFEASGISTSTTFATPGDHEVSLRVTDDLDAQDVHTISVPVHEGNLPPEIYSIYLVNQPRAGHPVEISAGAMDPDGYIGSYAWELDGDDDFDDGVESSSYITTTFATAGEHTIKVRVADDEGATVERTHVFDVREVGPNLPPQVSISGPSRTRTNTTTYVSAMSNDPDGSIASHDWDLDGDGAYGDSTSQYPTVSFPTEGTYHLRVRVTDDAGAVANAALTIRVDDTNLPPTVDLWVNPGTPKPGQQATFQHSVHDPEQGGQHTVRYDWGDGSAPTVLEGYSYSAQHTFAQAGAYEVKVTVTDRDGASGSTTRTIRVSGENLDPIIRSFWVSHPKPKAGDQVQLTAWVEDLDGSWDPWSGSGVTYAWELDGDGDYNDATSSSATRIFPTPGVFDIGLRVTDANGGTSTLTKTLHVASQQPEAGFTITPEHPTTEDTVSFQSTSTDPDGTIASSEWDLDGDGEYDDATGATATKRYSEVGEYRVALRVRDDNDDVDVRSTWIQVRCGDCPVAAFTYAPGEPSTGEEITLTSTSTDAQGPLAAQAWDLDGDGMFDDATGATATVTFARAGRHQVGLRVTDSDGKRDERYLTIEVGNRAPTGTFSWTPQAPRTGDEVTFTATASDSDGTVASLAWDMDGDGRYDDGSGATATRAFTSPGNKFVRLRVTDDGGATAFVGHVVTIANRAPVAAVTHSPASPLTNQTITFSGATSSDPDGGVVAYAWDLDDDGAYDDATGVSATRQFDRPGAKTVRLRVRDTAGDEATTAYQVTVGNRAPVAAFTASPEYADVNEDITFTSTSTDPDGPADGLRFAWDVDGDGYDDGETSSITRSFPAKDTYAIKLRVTDADGGVAEQTMRIGVGNDRPLVSFTSSPEAPLTGQPVTFTSTSTDPDGAVVAYAWDLDGDSVEDFTDGTGATASRSYGTPGEKLIRLKVTDDRGGSAVGTSTVTIGNRPPTASFSASDETLELGQPVKLTSTSTDADGPVSGLRYEWDKEGDGYDDGTTKSIDAAYDAGGTYTVRLRVTDAFGGSSVAERTLTVRERNLAPSVHVWASRSEARIGQQVVFYASAYDNDGDGIAKFEWDANRDGDFDDAGDTEGPYETQQAFTFTEAGEQTVKVRVTDGMGETAIGEGKVTVHAENKAPYVYLSTSSNRVRVGSDVTFYAYAHDSDDGIGGYEWDTNGDGDYTDAGDQSGETLTQITLTATTGGTMKVGVRVKDTATPAATGERTAEVEVKSTNSPPVPQISHYPYEALRGQLVNLYTWYYDEDWDRVVKYEWDLDGDGRYDGASDVSGATAWSTSRTFATAGTYTINVRLTDEGGAVGERAYEVRVRNSPPRASILTDAVAPETGETIVLRSEATDTDGTIEKVEWDTDADGDYDDGSDGGTARMTRDTAGVYYVYLKVTDNDGETGTAYRAVTFRNPSNVGVPVPERVELPGGSAMNIGTTINPQTGQTTITVPNGEISRFDPENRCVPLTGDFRIKSGRGIVSGAVLIVRYNGTEERVALEHLEDENWRWRLKCALNASLFVAYDLTETDTETGEEITESFEIPLGGIQLIDPQGVVYDEAEYTAALAAEGVTHETATDEQKTAARAVAAISGATVRLQRYDAATDTWKSVLAGDPGISPNVNPQTTGDNGLYQWDVSAGVYRVLVSAVGYGKVESTAVTIPPPVLDLHIPMVRNAPPTALMQASSTNVARGEQLTLTSQSTDVGGSITATQWDLDGDGQFDDADGTAVTHAFDSLGTKTIKMRVTDNQGGTDVATQEITVVNAPPTATLTAPATSPTKTPVTFVVDAADADGTIASVAWALDEDDRFDDTGDGFTITRSFDRSDAAREVKVRVTDSDGASVVKTATLAITNQAPTATLADVASVATGTAAQLSVAAADVDGTIASIGWDLDADGEFDDATGATASKAFARSGSYPVKVRVTDDEGAAVTREGTVTVTNRAPSLRLRHTASSPTKVTVSFEAIDVNDPDGLAAPAVAWDLDADGAYDDATGATASRSFDRSGTYTVRARVTDDEGASATEAGTIAIANREPVGALVVPAAKPTKTAVEFSIADLADADGIAAPTVAWDLDEGDAFDDGSGATVSRSFDRSGSYPVRARITDDEGASVVKEGTMTITNRAPSATLVVPPATPTKTAVQLSVTGLADADGLAAPTVAWDLDEGDAFDDGSGATASRSFDRSGSYPVRARITDDEGATVIESGTVTITNRAPSGTLQGPATVATLTDATFTVADVADPDGIAAPTVAWDLDDDGGFDDGTGASATGRFAKAGTRQVRARITDDQNESVVVTKAVAVTNQAPTATLSGPAKVRTGEDATFEVAPADVDGSVAKVEWDLDEQPGFEVDGGKALTRTARFSKSDASRVVKVKVTDDDGGTVVVERTLVVENRGPSVSISIAPDAPKAPAEVTLTAAASDPDGSVKAIEWDLDNDGGFDDATGEAVKRALAAGAHTVKVRVTDDEGATAVAEKSLTVAEADKPVVPVEPPVEPPVVTPPADTTAPAGTAKGLGSTIKVALAKGVAIELSCDEACAASGEIKLDARTAKKLGLGSKPVVIASGKTAMAAGKGKLTLKFTSKAKKALKKQRKAIKLKVVVTLVDAAGNRRTVPATIALKK